MKAKKRTVIIIISVILGLGLVYYLATIAIPRILVTMTKAAPAKKVSFEQSLVLGEKILAKADGKDKGKVNVFILDPDGKGVQNKRVGLTSLTMGLKIEPGEGMSNGDGRVSFEMSSITEGQWELRAAVEGIELARGVKVTFRN